MAQRELFESESALPSGLVHVPEFITEREETALIEAIRSLDLEEARYKEFTARRRVASFGAGYDFVENELTPAPTIAAFLIPLREKVARWAGISADDFGYALVSEYRPGTQLGWHRDVPQFETVAATALGVRAPRRGALGLAAQHRAHARVALLRHLPHSRHPRVDAGPISPSYTTP